MNEIKLSLAFGAALMIGGGSLFRWHFAQWAEQKRDESLSDREKSFLRALFRRRVQVAVLIVLLGIFLPILDYVSTTGSARWFTLLAIGALLVTFWIMILAALDWLSQRVFRRAMDSRKLNLRRMRRALEEEADRLRRRHSNGKPEE